MRLTRRIALRRTIGREPTAAIPSRGARPGHSIPTGDTTGDTAGGRGIPALGRAPRGAARPARVAPACRDASGPGRPGARVARPAAAPGRAGSQSFRPAGTAAQGRQAGPCQRHHAALAARRLGALPHRRHRRPRLRSPRGRRGGGRGRAHRRQHARARAARAGRASPTTSSPARSPSATASTTSTSTMFKVDMARRQPDQRPGRRALRGRAGRLRRRAARCSSRWPTRATCSPSTTSRS